jgi:hypothetical protein
MRDFHLWAGFNVRVFTAMLWAGFATRATLMLTGHDVPGWLWWIAVWVVAGVIAGIASPTSWKQRRRLWGDG